MFTIDARSDRIASVLDRVREGVDVAGRVTLIVTDPDLFPHAHSGESVQCCGRTVIHRPLRVWVDVAERLQLRLAVRGRRRDMGLVLELHALRRERKPWDGRANPTERYGTDTAFQSISKLDDPYFVIDLREAIGRVELPAQARVLVLGVNRGDEIELLRDCVEPRFVEWVGIDHCASVLAVARQRFPDAQMIEADINELSNLDIGQFDLVVSIDTLHSPGIDERALLRHLFQERLNVDGSMILGVPNCQYVDGQTIYGARTKNASQPELSLLIKSVAFFKKYLQQHKRRVFIAGKDQILITAIPYRARSIEEP